GAGGAPDLPAHLLGPARGSISDCRHGVLPSLLLAFLAEDLLARVLHAFALVGLGLAEGANLGGDLTDLLPVDAADHDLGRLRRRDRDAVGNRISDVVGEAELELQVLALHRGAISDAGDLEPALEALGDALHHVLDERAVGPPHGTGALGLGARIDPHLAFLHLGLDVGMQHHRQRALRALDLDGLAFHAGGDAGGYG